MGSQQNGALVQEGAFSVHLGKMLDGDSTLAALGQGQENRRTESGTSVSFCIHGLQHMPHGPEGSLLPTPASPQHPVCPADSGTF